MSRSAQLLPPQPPLPRSLWPTDMPIGAAEQLGHEPPTEPRIVLPWAATGPGDDAGPGWASSPADRRALAALDATALPYRLEAHVSLAVALDVLATRLSHVVAEERVLSTVTEALLGLRLSRSGGEGPMDEEALAAGAQLRRTALGPTGEARAALAPMLAACAPALGQVRTAADGVALASAQVIACAQEVILRARLALEAKQAQDVQSRPGSR